MIKMGYVRAHKRHLANGKVVNVKRHHRDDDD